MRKLLSVFAALSCLLAMTVCVTPAASAEEKIRVACCGDSITEGWTSSDLDTCSYPGQLGKMLDASQYEIKNYGAGGRCALKNAGDYKAYWDEKDFYQASLNFKPNIVILMLGTNDVVCNQWQEDGANYRADLTALVQSYQELESKPTVYLCTPCYSTDASHTDKIQNVAAPIVREVAEATGATLVDVNEYTENYAAEGGLNPDGIHLSDDGYLRLAGYFYDVIFHGECSTLTVATEAGNVVSADGMYITADETGKAVLRLKNGTKTVRVRNGAGGYGSFTLDLTKDTVADCRGLTIPENLANAAGTLVIATSCDGQTPENVCDGDENTTWQLADSFEYGDGLYIGFDFGSEKTFDTVDFVWNQDSHPTESGYVLEISADGEKWEALTDERTAIFSARSTATLTETTARYLRVRLSEGSSDKYRPLIREIRVISSKGDFTPVFTEGTEVPSLTSEEEETEQENKPGVGLYLLISAGVVVVAGLAAALTVRKQKKSAGGPNSVS